MSTNTLARGVAQVSLGSSAGTHGDWSVQGAMSQGDVAGWLVSGSYVTHMPARHAYDAGMSYALQRYDGTNAAALSAMAGGNRYAAVLYAFDAWTINSRVSLLYGGQYARYGYLENPLFSPRARVTLAATTTLRLSAGAAQRVIAPGAEEFSPSMVAGTWLPPERTFAPLAGTSFAPERTVSYDVSAEQDLSPTTVLGVRAFHQQTDDQLVTLFGLGTVERPAADLGHYYAASVGDVIARGWTVSLRQVIGERVHGSVDYTVTSSDWQSTPEGDLVSLRLPGVVRQGAERVQDVTAAVDTTVPVTETHVVALYRISTGYAGGTVGALGAGVAARFDVQVSQSLPFMDFSSAHWEMLVGVRNLFHDASEDASVYDELLVTRPPKRIVGGLTLRF
jgi:outer membrane receptor for ferrienterochelin and colicin